MSSLRILTMVSHGSRLLGVLHMPAGASKRGVLLVTGGPQYRVGSHRQYLLFARALAEHGIAALRFDLRGMGDSEGEVRPYHQTQDDMLAAINAMYGALPELNRLFLWGLCDGATAAALYSLGDKRVDGLMLLNPWLHDAALQQQVLWRYYYPRRLFSRQFWGKLMHSICAPVAALGRLRPKAMQGAQSADRPALLPISETSIKPEQMLYDALAAFSGAVLIILSGADFGAKQLLHLQASRQRWRRLLGRDAIQLHTIADANHTFASAHWRAQVSQCCIAWLGDD